MKNSIKLATYINAVLIYLILFYSTSLFAETFTDTFDVDLGAQLTVKTDAGSIKVETHDEATIELRGELNARSSGGSINVGNIVGDVKLHTSGGSINTDTVTGNLDAHTSGGSINVTIDKQLSEDAKLTTSGGSITAYLIADIQLDINASTSGGRVKSDFEIDGRVKKMSVRGSINGGGPKLTLKTSGGSIKIKEI